MRYTLDLLKKMSAKERRGALNNNKKNAQVTKFADDARHNIQLIESSGLTLGPERELQDGDWQLREIELIVNHPSNEAAMLDAVAHGEPPLSAVEHLIIARLGNEYKGSERRDTVRSGEFVARRLYALGYEKIEGGEKPMPAGSVAKTAATFRKTKSSR